MPDFGDNSPRENYGALDPLAPSVANGQITPEQWAQYQARRNRDRILGILGLAGATTGLGALGGMLGGAGAGAGAAAGGGGSLAPVTGGAPWAVTPYATSATMVGTGAGTGAGVGAGLGAAGRTFLGMSPRDLLSLGLSGAGAIGGALQRPPNLNPNTATQDPNLQRLLQTMQGRLDKSEPLYDSIMAMANGLLPTQYQKGGGGVR